MDHRSSELRTFFADCHVVRAVVATALLAFSSVLSPAGAQTQPSGWISTWTASPQAPRGAVPTSFSDRTVRQIVHVSIGGDKVRLRLSNEFGTRPVLIGAASVGLSAGGSDIASGSLRALTFGGSKSVILTPGAPALSDPVALDVAPLSDLAVSLYLPSTTDLGTVHQAGLQTAYISRAGDFTAASEFPAEDRFGNRFFLTGVMVEPQSPARAIVTFGDSITDGSASTVNANRRWPDVLAGRLKNAGAAVAVLNQGIAGNRVLSDGLGVSALARFERDVPERAGRYARGALRRHQRYRSTRQRFRAERNRAHGRRNHCRLQAIDRTRPSARDQGHRQPPHAVRTCVCGRSQPGVFHA